MTYVNTSTLMECKSTTTATNQSSKNDSRLNGQAKPTKIISSPPFESSTNYDTATLSQLNIVNLKNGPYDAEITFKDDAATQIQTLTRGYLTRKNLSKQNTAAIKIQTQTRRYLNEKNKPTKEKNVDQKENQTDDLTKQNTAATKIQTLTRGYLTRNNIKNSKNTAMEKNNNQNGNPVDEFENDKPKINPTTSNNTEKPSKSDGFGWLKRFGSGLVKTVCYNLGMFTWGLLRPFFNELKNLTGIKVLRPKKETCSYNLGTQLGRPLILLACGVKGIYYAGYIPAGIITFAAVAVIWALGAIAYGGAFIALAIANGK